MDRQKNSFYTSPSSMEPLWPQKDKEHLEGLCLTLAQKSSALSAKIHPETARGLSELLCEMNSYYSNLIEGQSTHPLSIHRALNKQYSKNTKERNLQQLNVAHIEAQRAMEEQIQTNDHLCITSVQFLTWLHKVFYENLPEDFLNIPTPDGQTLKLKPGELRTTQVEVGEHLPPHSDSLPQFMNRFQTTYDPKALSSIQSILAMAASHHRLTWIHPFLDGNGRVGRLFTEAYLRVIQMNSHGLWSISRGLARQKDKYLQALAAADDQRRSDLDGRGNLSDQGLSFFCRFFLDIAIDQVEFMTGLLTLEHFEQNLKLFIDTASAQRTLRPEAFYVFREVFLRGTVPRGDMSRITGQSERSARTLLGELLKKGFLTSKTPKSPVRLRFPPLMAAYCFPRLYPEGVEAEMRTSPFEQ